MPLYIKFYCISIYLSIVTSGEASDFSIRIDSRLRKTRKLLPQRFKAERMFAIHKRRIRIRVRIREAGIASFGQKRRHGYVRMEKDCWKWNISLSLGEDVKNVSRRNV